MAGKGIASSLPSAPTFEDQSKLARRSFLPGLGGAAIAAPFSSTLGVRRATGQTEAAAPKRIIPFFTHYDCITEMDCGFGSA